MSTDREHRKKITAHRELALVEIEGHQISGWIDEDVRCKSCSASRIYYDDYDAFFCPECNVWLEGTCRDSSCNYCRSRPDRPLPGK